ncbi:PIR protein [Plasmodium ovale]|uniref:PIR protein n=1 Tax=Plasmodium ovale TaxID=36330 RepID=A0A1C3KIX8_PLAOA|nr:PIR protein [Plasmodium ovale]
MSISVDELPSNKFGSIWNEGICYNEVNDIIADKKGPVHAFRWKENVREKFSINLEEYKVKIKDNTLEKRCRDLYYLIYDKLYQLKKLSGYSNIYDSIKAAIMNNIDSAFLNIRYPSCLSVTNKEDYYKHIDINDSKRVDDLCEDIKYIDNNIIRINSSSECKQIKEHIYGRNNSLKTTYNSGKYSDILKHYEFLSFNKLDSIIEKIKCNSDANTEQTALKGDSLEIPQLSVEHLPMAVIFSFLGILLIFFFLYKFTPAGTWLKIQIRKKLKLDNNLTEETENELLEGTSECIRNNPYDDKYNILYNTSGHS